MILCFIKYLIVWLPFFVKRINESSSCNEASKLLKSLKTAYMDRFELIVPQHFRSIFLSVPHWHPTQIASRESRDIKAGQTDRRAICC